MSSSKMVKYGALAGVLGIPSLARALSDSSSAGSAGVSVTLQASLQGQLTVTLVGRSGLTLLNTATADTVNFGFVDTQGNMTGTEGASQSLSGGGAVYIAPMTVTVAAGGTLGATLQIGGSFSHGTTPIGVGDANRKAQWKCVGTGTTPNWGVTNLSSGFNIQTVQTCLTVPTGTAGSVARNVDAVIYLGAAAASGQYTATFNFTAQPG